MIFGASTLYIYLLMKEKHSKKGRKEKRESLSYKDMKMEKIEKQIVVDNLTMETKDKPSPTDDETETNYRGVKTMPFIIGK